MEYLPSDDDRFEDDPTDDRFDGDPTDDRFDGDPTDDRFDGDPTALESDDDPTPVASVGDGFVGGEPSADDAAAVLAAMESDLEAVERALARLDEGTYGQCEVCGGEIGDEALVRSPLTRTCPEHLPLPLA